MRRLRQHMDLQQERVDILTSCPSAFPAEEELDHGMLVEDVLVESTVSVTTYYTAVEPRLHPGPPAPGAERGSQSEAHRQSLYAAGRIVWYPT